ncbi:branched-chain alpha-keto acid dehydrogenase subunit E2 [Bacillus sp. SA1-12]|uniref:dihydrolipoamide acetyltransferase family protein n=1 Tax=Bacillus sp. SA1-12 TaxID=1455638 RepID=UPI000625417E|nr:dihydrolipoamide acetyltransferase family protein [Bacillus sp. SA1-12]KKI91981.1 branched-chain alpha-keto acid dehydrogenase subunit E2 [Bacillus sp. SA1-12]
MAIEVVMPKLGMSMKEGTVSFWNKHVGETVNKGELLAGISSEKIETDLEAPVDGTLIEIAVQEGNGVPPGTPICFIGNPDEKIASPVCQQTEAVEKRGEDEAAGTNGVRKSASNQGMSNEKQSIKVSPVAKKMAEKAGLKLEQLKGSGPNGRITKEDVLQAIEEEKNQKLEQESSAVNQDPGSVNKTHVSGMRKVIATRMQESLLHSAQLTINMKADVTDLIRLQKSLCEELQDEIRLSLNDFIARAVVLTLKKHKNMNSALINDAIESYKHVHLGIAVALEKGLVVPVVRHAEACSLLELSKTIKSHGKQARAGQLTTEQMSGSTFTITNLAFYGVEHFTPILNTPESGILGVGAATDTPVFVGEELQRRSILPLSLTFDHRVLDGAPAAEFLKSIKQLLEKPYLLLL